VVPSIVVKKWEKELAKWLPNEKVFRISKRKVVVPSDSTIVVTTYDLLKSTQGRMRKLKPKACVIDECHMIKNYKAQRTQAFLEFLDRTGISKIVALSGTPIVNRPAEFYTVLRILAPEEFPSWKYYTERYCGATWNGYGWDLKGATNTQELAERVRNVMIRRNKSEVLTDLPDKHRCHLPIELNRKELNEYRSAIHGEYSGKKTPTQAEHLASIAAARQWVAKRKAKEAIDFAKESYAQGEPLIIFAVHHATIETIVDGCRKAGMKVGQIDGRVSSSKREDIASSFQDGELDVVVLGIRSGGVGIDLFRGSNVLMVERGWTPGEEEQAEDRSHRNGQTNAVVVHYLHVEQTVDDMMDELIEKKRQVLNSVLDGGKNLDEGVDIRDELLVNWMEQYG
jgi:SNF2 family DNA or RNA helicase